LKHLEIGFSSRKTLDSYDAFCHHVDLNYNTDLSSTTIVANYPKHYHREAAYILRVHSNITLPRIQAVEIRLSIRVDFAVIDFLAAIDWDGLERILQQPNHSGLQEFVISAVSRDMLAETTMWLYNKAPTLKERAVIVDTIIGLNYFDDYSGFDSESWRIVIDYFGRHNICYDSVICALRSISEQI